MADITQWLHARGLGDYSELFCRERIDLEVLHLLSEADLSELGIPMGDRKRIHAAQSESRSTVAPADFPSLKQGVERRQVTIIICDLVDSTVMAQALDPEDMSRLNGFYQDVCKEAVERYDGHVLQYRGDAVIACFGYPVAHDRDAERAVRAALDMIDALTKITIHPVVQESRALSMRIGIATGPTVVGALREGDPFHADAVGETPNLAARLQSLAQPNEIIVSDLTRLLVSERFEMTGLGKHDLKGFREPVLVHRVTAIASPVSYGRASSSRAVAPLIGRDNELVQLLALWSEALGGRGQSALLVGEPGIGKSRLVYELQQSIRGDEPIRWLYYCSPYHENSPLFPIIEQLGRGFRFSHDDDLATRLRKVEQGVGDLNAAQVDIVPYLASLLGLAIADSYDVESIDAKDRKQRTYTALIDLISAAAIKAPLLVVVEDMHWMDPSTRELLSELLPKIANQRVFVVLTTRTGSTPSLETVVGELIELSALDLIGSERLIRSIDDARVLTTDAVSDIVGHTTGIPLFIEETTVMVLNDMLRERRDGRPSAGRGRRISTPATLNEMLMARLDRLGSSRDIALVAAVIGQPFTAELLAGCMTHLNQSVDADLQKMVDDGTLHMRHDRSTVAFEFRHALLRDVAYASLLKSTRRELHRRVADALLELAPELNDLEPEILAHHLTEAGIGGQSVDLWRRAGEVAMHRSANAEAVAHLRKGLSVLETQPPTAANLDRRLALLIALIGPLLATTSYGSPQLDEAIQEAINLCREIGPTDRIFPILYGRWLFTQAIGRHRLALSLAQEYMDLSADRGDAMPRIGAYRALAWSYFNLGEPVMAAGYLSRAQSSFDAQLHRQFALLYGTDHEIGIGCGMVQTFWVLGRVAEAWRAGQVVLERAYVTNHGLSLFLAGQWGGCLLNALLGRWLDVEKLAAEMEVNGSKYAVQGAILAGHFYRRLAQAFQTGSQEAQRDAGAAIDTAIGAGYMLMMPFWMIILADSCRVSGRLLEAGQWLERADKAIVLTDDRWAEPELYRVRGELALALGKIEDAVMQNSAALAIARLQSAKSWELRTATSRAALHLNVGISSGVLDDLRSILATIDAPFDYPDLIRARQFLNDAQTRPA